VGIEMKYFKKVKNFLLLNKKLKLLIFEAYILLGIARIMVILPFSKVAPSLGTPMLETPINKGTINNDLLNSVSEALNIMSNHTPWESKCFVRAIAGMKMLERRNIESTLYLGTAKDENGRMIAHAWLRSGDFYVTGKEEMELFNVVAKFAKTSDKG
jgi:hypothetical protein